MTKDQDGNVWMYIICSTYCSIRAGSPSNLGGFSYEVKFASKSIMAAFARGIS